MPPTEPNGMLFLGRHSQCPLGGALDVRELPWEGLRYSCLNILHLYCKIFDKTHLLDMLLRKTCSSCGCAREQHAVFQAEAGGVRARLGLRDAPTPHHDHAYEWAPPGLTTSQVEAYFGALPAAAGAGGERYWRWRARALAAQLPRQDLARAHCRHLADKHRAAYEDFVAARNEIALDIAYATQQHAPAAECPTCRRAVRAGHVAVVAPKIDEEARYHPACFKCTVCEELLVDLAYCALDGLPYCERHYAETLKPRCASCDEVSITFNLA